MTDIIRLDAATLAAKIAAKELSSTEVTQAYLDQIAATDQRYGAFLHVAADAALSAGREAAQQQLRDALQRISPHHGRCGSPRLTWRAGMKRCSTRSERFG